MLNERLGILSTIEPYIGKYYSNKWVRGKVLRQTDTEMIEMDEQIQREIADGVIPDPNASIDPETGQPMDNLGDIPMDSEIDGSSTEVDGKQIEI